MTNIFGILNTGKVALLSQQTAIQVTGQNIANVNTEGYSKQEVNFEAASPIQAIPGMLGTGIKITGIQRNFDQFIQSQINFETSTLGNFKAQKEVLAQVEILFSDISAGGLTKAMNEFYGALQDLSVNPQGLTERESVLGKAQTVVTTSRRMGNDLMQKRININESISNTIDKVNQLTSQISQLNKKIHEAESGPGVNSNANDLRDQRDKKINELADLIDIQTLEENNNQITITTSRGKQLVLGQTPYSLSTKLNGNNFGLYDIMLDDGQGNLTNITGEISGGQLAGMVESRDVFIDDKIKRLDIFTAGLVREVNKLHIRGYGLDGSTGNNFFNPLSVTARSNTNNTGSAAISVAINAPSTASVSEYRIQLTGSNTFSLTNVTTGASSGTFTFSSGTPVNLGNGLSVTLTGSAAANDIFTFSSSESAASNIDISSTVLNNKEKVAAGSTKLRGDGSNALAIADLQNDLLFESNTIGSGSGTFTFEDFYSAIISDVGLKTSDINENVTQQESITTQLTNRREEISGVSLDEEMINLIMFQQAYAAAARIISSVDEMLTTVRNLVR